MSINTFKYTTNSRLVKGEEIGNRVRVVVEFFNEVISDRMRRTYSDEKGRFFNYKGERFYFWVNDVKEA